MNETIDNLQDLSLCQKGFAISQELIRRYRTDNPGSLKDDEVDALEYYIASASISLANKIKELADQLK